MLPTNNSPARLDMWLLMHTFEMFSLCISIAANVIVALVNAQCTLHDNVVMQFSSFLRLAFLLFETNLPSVENGM